MEEKQSIYLACMKLKVVIIIDRKYYLQQFIVYSCFRFWRTLNWIRSQCIPVYLPARSPHTTMLVLHIWWCAGMLMPSEPSPIFLCTFSAQRPCSKQGTTRMIRLISRFVFLSWLLWHIPWNVKLTITQKFRSMHLVRYWGS